MLPSTNLTDCPQADLLCVPGGFGTRDVMQDEETLQFLRDQAAEAQYVTSVCTGSLALGAAGLLKGKRATSHWAYTSLLEKFGATYEAARVVKDGKCHYRRRGNIRHRLCPDRDCRNCRTTICRSGAAGAGMMIRIRRLTVAILSVADPKLVQLLN